MITIEMCMA